MKFEDSYFSRDARYSIGIESASGRHYLAIPVSNGITDYEEYYELTLEQYGEFLTDTKAATSFAESVRRHERDENLIQTPGANRGTPA
ncbi:hypothetical protein [Speluncibacter jeojiensis]|uniref:Uncharacterized protein n=1 Tax=Speluncibacter jeojiensis TaxID=2710754 RepID=A0A9X4LYE4_9ACTN|nr:hypothetical protein [Corynebacteriales bacterium D3-21]